jgi:hypothetical protein
VVVGEQTQVCVLPGVHLGTPLFVALSPPQPINQKHRLSHT